MSSKKNPSKKDVADDAARARKLLDKNAPAKVSGMAKTPLILQQGGHQYLGSHAVLMIVTDQKIQQFTISGPIGVTDLDPKDWVISRTEDIPSMLARKADPALGELNQLRSHARSSLAVSAHLLIEKEVTGKKIFYYPHRDDSSRNDLLSHAQSVAKEATKAISKLIEDAEDQAEKQRLQRVLAKEADPKHHMDEATAQAERNLQEFYAMPEVIAAVEFNHPQDYRTLTGPYGDEKQVAIRGGRGLNLDALVNKISRHLMNDMGFETPPGAAMPPPEGEPGGDGESPSPTGGTRTRRLSSLVSSAVTKGAHLFSSSSKPKEPEKKPDSKAMKEEEVLNPLNLSSAPPSSVKQPTPSKKKKAGGT